LLDNLGDYGSKFYILLEGLVYILIPGKAPNANADN